MPGAANEYSKSPVAADRFFWLLECSASIQDPIRKSSREMV